MKHLPRLWVTFVMVAGTISAGASPPVDRHRVVSRHNVTLRAHDPFHALTVGNGEFAYTVDVTGAQTFPEAHETTGIPLATQSHWAWHIFPNRGNYQPKDVLEPHDYHGRPVPYATNASSSAGEYLRRNPHRLDLGEIGFVMQKLDATTATLQDINNIEQTLDLSSGIISSNFVMEGYPVEVRTCVDPKLDCVALQVDSQLVTEKRLHIRLRFPYAGDEPNESKDWNSPERHSSDLMEPNRGRFIVRRKLDMYRYGTAFTSETSTTVKAVGPHEFLVSPIGESPILDFACHFSGSGDPLTQLPDAEPTFTASADHWDKFWKSGAAVDLSGSPDVRAAELERRIVLSQYLTAVQCAGALPPQETGLTGNRNFGKVDVPSHWESGAHFALWGRPVLLERSLQWYADIMPRAEETARTQGFTGARWPALSGPEGRETPSPTVPLLTWHQPHPIYFAELAYQANPTTQTARKWANVVNRTAEFMASFVHWDEELGRPVIGTPGAPPPPPFQQPYWAWGIATAQEWRVRSGRPREQKWDEILEQLGKPGEGEMARMGGQLASFTLGETQPRTGLKIVLQDVTRRRCLPNGHFVQEDGTPVDLPTNGALLALVALLSGTGDFAATDGIQLPQ